MAKKLTRAQKEALHNYLGTIGNGDRLLSEEEQLHLAEKTITQNMTDSQQDPLAYSAIRGTRYLLGGLCENISSDNPDIREAAQAAVKGVIKGMEEADRQALIKGLKKPARKSQNLDPVAVAKEIKAYFNQGIEEITPIPLCNSNIPIRRDGKDPLEPGGRN